VPDREAAGPPRVAASNGGAEPAPASLDSARLALRLIYEEARARAVSLGALLNSVCDIIEADETAVVLGFKYPLHAEKAAASQNLDALSEIVSRVLQRQVAVRCVHDPNVGSWRQREPASRSSLVRAAQEMGARILSPGPEDQI
jgi:hypothetical protein